MKLNLFATVALCTSLACAPAFAQQSEAQVGNQNAGTAPASVGSNSASNANSNANQNLINGGSSANNGGVTVGPDTATSSSNSGAVSLSGSSSTSQGGNSDSHSAATGGTSSAVTGASTATNGAANSANQQNITFNQTTPTNTKAHIETTPQVYAPALTTTLTETCMGSTSGGVSVMGFGGTLGTSWEDKQCIRRLNAREMAQTLGDRDAARALLCQDVDVAKAYAAIGQSCTEKVAVIAPPPPISPVVINNNIPPAPTPPPPVMAPIPNPPEPQTYSAPRHRARPKNIPACQIEQKACPSAHDD